MSTKLTLTEQVLKASLSSPDPFDVKFLLFSKRRTVVNSQGQWKIRVEEPRIVLAASAVLNKVDYFRGSWYSPLS